MRSRLEADFAANLDRQGISWVYEPVCYASRGGQYLPDFQITKWKSGEPPGSPTFVEVKPTSQKRQIWDHLRKMHVIRASEPTASLMVVCFAGSYSTDSGARVQCAEFDKCDDCVAEQSAVMHAWGHPMNSMNAHLDALVHHDLYGIGRVVGIEYDTGSVVTIDFDSTMKPVEFSIEQWSEIELLPELQSEIGFTGATRFPSQAAKNRKNPPPPPPRRQKVK